MKLPPSQPTEPSRKAAPRLAAQTTDDKDVMTIRMAYRPPAATLQLNTEIDARTKRGLDALVFAHRQAGSGYGTLRIVVEEAVKDWMKRHPAPEVA